MDAPDSESSFGSEFSEDPQGAEEPHDSDIADRVVYDDARREHLAERRLRALRLSGGHCLLANLLSEGKLGGVTTLRSLVKRARAAVAAALPADKDSYKQAFYLSLLWLELHQALPAGLVTDADRQGMTAIQHQLSAAGGDLADSVQHACRKLERQWPTGEAAPRARSASRSAHSRTGSHGSRSRRRSRSQRRPAAPASSEPAAEVKRESDAASAGDGGAAPPSVEPPLPPPAAAPPAQPLDHFQIRLDVLDHWATRVLTSLSDRRVTGEDAAQRDRGIATAVAELRRAAAATQAREPIEEEQACKRAEETARSLIGHKASHWVKLACGELAQVKRGQGVTAELAVQRIVLIPTSADDLESELSPQETRYLNALYETVKVDGAVDHDKTGALYSRLEDAFRASHGILEAFTAKDGSRYAARHEDLRKACDILGHAAKMRRGKGNEQVVAGRYHGVCEKLQELLREVASPHNSMKAAGYHHRLQAEAFKLNYNGPKDKVREYKRPPLSAQRAEEESLETYLRTRPPSPKVWQPPVPSTSAHAGEEVLAKFAEGHPNASHASGKHGSGKGHSKAEQPPRKPVSFPLRPPGGGLGLDTPQAGHPPKPPPPKAVPDQPAAVGPSPPPVPDRSRPSAPVPGSFSKSVPSAPWRRPTPDAPLPKTEAPLPTAATWPHVAPVTTRRPHDSTAPWSSREDLRKARQKTREEQARLERYEAALLGEPVPEASLGAPKSSPSAASSKHPGPAPLPEASPPKQGQVGAVPAASPSKAPPGVTLPQGPPPATQSAGAASAGAAPKHSSRPTTIKSRPPAKPELPKSPPTVVGHEGDSSASGAPAQQGDRPADPRERPVNRPAQEVAQNARGDGEGSTEESDYDPFTVEPGPDRYFEPDVPASALEFLDPTPPNWS